MKMKNRFFLCALFAIIAVKSVAQQIPLKGEVSVQNSKTNTGNIQYVKNAELTHPNAKPTVTGKDGNFTLKIKGVKPNAKIQITVTLHGAYSDYIVVKKKNYATLRWGRRCL